MNVKKLYNLLRSFAFFIVNFPKIDEAVNKKIHFKYIYIATVKFATQFKAGVMKAVFWLVITVLTQISRLSFKQSRISMLNPEIYVLGLFVTSL